MRTIEATNAFKRDFRRVTASSRYRDIDDILAHVVDTLRADATLPERCRDHGLVGNWVDHRECHLKPDLLLIYAKPDADTLRLVRIGSHADLFG